MSKTASPDHPIHELISKRWSPYSYSNRPVPPADLLSIFEAARWAASSFNEQPWRYIVATRDQPDDYNRILSCLLEGNRTWAEQAPVLALGCIRQTFSRNNKPNRVAQHDLGLASASLSFEATSRGVYVHQMAGLMPDKARAVFAIPDGFEAVTGLTLGYRAEAGAGDPGLLARDERPRTRRPLGDFVFGGRWGSPGFASSR